MSSLLIRETHEEDIESLFDVRARTRENPISREHLAAMGITAASTAARLRSGDTKVRFWSHEDGWSTGGARISDPGVIERIRHAIEEEGPDIVEHRFYRGSCAPNRRIFDDVGELLAYLDAHAAAGDAVSVSAVCRDENALALGMCPDDSGRVPARGAC